MAIRSPACLLIVTLASSCASRYAVVSAEAYRNAGKSTRQIIEQEGAGAQSILKSLGRIKSTADVNVELNGAKNDENSMIAALSAVRREEPETTSTEAKKDFVLEEGAFVETVTAIAFDAQLDPTAIPALAVGYRPGKTAMRNRWLAWAEGTAVELLLGGALNPQSGDSSNVELALGAGLSFPVGEVATLAVGYIRWNPSDGDIDEGMYLGLTFGPRPAANNEN